MTLPLSGTVSPAMISSSVDFPQPLGPTRQRNSPGATVSETSSRACTEVREVRNHFDTPSRKSWPMESAVTAIE